MLKKLVSILLIALISANSITSLVTAYDLSDKTSIEDMPLSFYVGKVMREFTDSGATRSLKTVDLENYIDTENEKITSVNGDLTLNYGEDKGFLVIDTEKAQGITGFMEKAPKELTDVKIDCDNEYAAILVVSMDDKEITKSNRLLIQSMTEEKLLGFETEDANYEGAEEGEQKIINAGSDLMQVKKIQATVALKGITKGYAAVLDENGYVRELLEPVIKDGNFEIAIPEDGIYVVYSKSQITAPEELTPQRKANTIWWEAEELSHKFEVWKGAGDPVDWSYTWDWLSNGDSSVLSGGKWLANTDMTLFNMLGESAAIYGETKSNQKISVPKDGYYSFYVRKSGGYGSFRWRFDNEEYRTHANGMTTIDEGPYVVEYHPVSWAYVDEVYLTEGEHTFRFEVVPVVVGEYTSGGYIGQPKYQTFGVDCFVLSDEIFIPNGKINPNDIPPSAEDGYFAFDPNYDTFTSESALNLRCLNEGYAGQDGNVKLSADGENFVLGNSGEKVKFWGVNAGPDVINQDKKTVDYLAKSLAKRGVNLVRMHGSVYDIVERAAVIKENYLDKIHYFIYAMKQQGIYVEISTYFIAWFNLKTANSGYADLYEDMGSGAPAKILQFNEEFQGIYKSGISQLLNSYNEYTKSYLYEEPAIAFFEIQNEDNYFWHDFSPANVPDVFMRELEGYFYEWLIDKYGSEAAIWSAWGSGRTDGRDKFDEGRAGLRAAWYMTVNFMRDHNINNGVINYFNEAWRTRMGDQIQFLTESQRQFYQEMCDYVRNDLKSKALIVPGNWATASPSNLEPAERYTYDVGDVIDRHGYFEPGKHTSTGGTTGYAVRLDDTYKDWSALHRPDKIPLKYVQNKGKTYMQSEIGWTNPNKYRAEAPILLAAYSALQGVDAPTLFTVSPHFETTITKFPYSTPVTLGQSPAAALLYRNGYVESTEPVVHETLNINNLYRAFESASYVNEDVNLDVFRQQQ